MNTAALVLIWESRKKAVAVSRVTCLCVSVA